MADPTKTPRLLTEDDVVAILHISLQTLRRMAKRGEIACYEFGRKRQFSESHITDYLESVECPQKVKNGATAACSSHAVTKARTGTAVGMTQKPTRLQRVPSELAMKMKPNES